MIEEFIKEPASIDDLYKMAGKKCNVHTYADLKNFNDLDDIFHNSDSEFEDDSAIILYKSEPTFGHWVMVSKNDDGYNYLDSYGEEIDNPLKYVPDKVNKELGQDKKYLAKLMLKKLEGGHDIYYNNAKLQKIDPNVSTCGRYCAMYLKFKHLNVDDFAKMIKKLSKKLDMSTDELITYMSMVDLDSE